MAVCHYHPERPGVGVCVRCRVVICAACCTRLDGINHCHACLRKLGARLEPARPRGELRGLTAGLLLALGGLLLAGLCWLGQGVLNR